MPGNGWAPALSGRCVRSPQGLREQLALTFSSSELLRWRLHSPQHPKLLLIHQAGAPSSLAGPGAAGQGLWGEGVAGALCFGFSHPEAAVSASRYQI